MERLRYIILLITCAAAAYFLARTLDMFISAIQKKVRQLGALRRVVAAAKAWADAERTLRQSNVSNHFLRSLGYDPDHIRRLAGEPDYDAIVDDCDRTENELLDAVEAAQATGLNLS